jgi:putative hemolysin
MVRNVFRLDERQVGSMMIPRAEIAWLDAEATPERGKPGALKESDGFARYPVCRGGLTDIVGRGVHPGLLQRQLRRGAEPDRRLEAPVFVPETLTGMELLEHFRHSDAPLVFVVDEYGEVQGVIALRDLLEAIAGEFSAPSDEEAWATQRGDGSWLLDGLIPVPELKDRLELKELPEEDRGRYNTLAGMIMLLLGRLPAYGRRGGVGGLAFRGRRPRWQARRQGARHPRRTQVLNPACL